VSFPLCGRQGSVVILDDDASYLEMLAMVLPPRWHVRLFLRPHDCVEALSPDTAQWEEDTWAQQEVVNRWRSGHALIPLILDYWSRSSERRHALTKVCVFDFSMPGMDGLQALAALSGWPGSRVLLTGQADEQVAVRAFNRGLIDQFIPKQMPQVSRRLIETLDHLMRTANPSQVQIWRATLSPGQEALLRQSGVREDLQTFAAEHWAEYMVIGEPFGVLGLDRQGRASWLQLESLHGLVQLAELASSAGVAAPLVREIHTGRQLVNLELLQALGDDVAPVFEPVFRLGGIDGLLAAHFSIPERFDPGPDHGYGTWLAKHGVRRIRD